MSRARGDTSRGRGHAQAVGPRHRRLRRLGARHELVRGHSVQGRTVRQAGGVHHRVEPIARLQRVRGHRGKRLDL